MHTKPEVLALLALGEHVADPADDRHLAACEHCRAELTSLTKLIADGRAAPDGDTLDAPSEEVWAAIQAELGFIPVTRSWPAAPEASSEEVPQSRPSSVGPTEDEPARNGRWPRGHRAIILALAVVSVVIAVLILIIGTGLGLAGL